jgi:acetyl/propionyl-CoA carboxylase alpha subunit
MSDPHVLLRDAAGRVYRVQATADGVSVDEALVRAEAQPDGSVLLRGGTTRLAWSAVAGDVVWVFVDGNVFTFETERPTGRRRRAALSHGSLSAPMPATVRHVAVEPGARVRHGDVLVVLEAMKMELPVRAPGDGTVLTVKCREGELVQAGQELIELEP